MNVRTTTWLLLSLVSIFAAATARADDPNLPAALSSAFAADWDAVTLTVTGYNPSGSPADAAPPREEVITVAGHVHVFDSNDLIAVSTTNTTPLWAFDQDGSDVVFDPNAVAIEPARTWDLGERAKPFRVSLTLDADQVRPTSLMQLDFTAEALYGRPFRTVAIPVEVTEDWIELAPDYRVHVTETRVVDETAYVTLAEEIAFRIASSASRSFDPNDGPWVDHVFRNGKVEPVSDYDYVARGYLGDIDGNEVGSGGGFRHPHSGMSTGLTTGALELTVGHCPTLEGAYIHLTFALKLYATPIHLTLTDIPIPGR